MNRYERYVRAASTLNLNCRLVQAMKRKSDMRVWVIFVLLVLTFTLLFLDWYNP